MPEESTTPDLVDLVRRSVDAVNRRDFDGFAGFFGSGSVRDLSPMGLGVYSAAEVRMHYASVNSEAGGAFERIANCTDIDEARTAAKRLAKQRRTAMSESLDLSASRGRR